MIIIKKLWNSIKDIVYAYMVQYFVIIVGISFYAFISKDDAILLDINKMYEVSIYGIVISSIPISIYLFNKYRVKGSKIKIPKLLLMIPLGMSISLFYNMLVFNLQSGEMLDINKILLFIYIVIVGPIFEEFVFRYVGLQRAKKEYPIKKAVIVISMLFAFLHSGLINMLYAFLIGIILSYIYIKYKNITYPIVLHISANLMSMLIKEFNIYALIISFIVLIIIYFYIKKEDHV